MDTYEKRNLLEKSYQSAVHEAWKQFIANKPIREKDIPPHILRSWKLSREAGMDPLNPQVPPVLNKRELASLCRQHQTLIDSAKPILDMLEVSIRDTGYIAILAVASGHLLAAVGDDNLLVQARSQYNIPGAQRSIKTIGASALSMSIVERAPIQITGYEHYNCWFHEWKCASAPIFNDNDIPIASLTISSHISCKDIHTLTLTTSCANCISIRLRESALIDTEKRLNAMLQRVLNSLPEAVVAIDGNGSITHANNKAANYLLPKNGVLVGKNIDDLFPKPGTAARPAVHAAGGSGDGGRDHPDARGRADALLPLRADPAQQRRLRHDPLHQHEEPDHQYCQPCGGQLRQIFL